MGDVDGAEQAFRTALEKNAREPEALNNLAWILADKRGSYQEALELAERAVAARPNDANFRDTLAFVLLRSDRLEEARGEYQRCADLSPAASPTRAHALLNLARVCRKLDQPQRVSEYLNEALAANSRQSIFTPEEQSEIEALLADSQKTN
jgi:Flp pilus assembly protein TadD